MDPAAQPQRAGDVLTPADHVLGPRDAQVLVVEYGDFECPLCAQARPGVRLLLRHFEDRIRFAFRHFPSVDAHPHAERAAEASEAAAAQGKFWPMHDTLFENQRHLKAPQLRRYAEEVGLDLARYDAEMANRIYLQRVQVHLADGRARGVRSTPGFLVDGAVVDVSFGMERLFDAVEARLAAQ